MQPQGKKMDEVERFKSQCMKISVTYRNLYPTFEHLDSAARALVETLQFTLEEASTSARTNTQENP
jgi:hypothetical protein